MLLGVGAGVGGNAILIQTSFIDNAEAAVVVVTGMNALDVLGQQGNDIAIAADIVVVGALAIFGFATGYQVFHAEGVVAFVGHAVDDQQFHGVVFQGFHFLTECFLMSHRYHRNHRNCSFRTSEGRRTARRSYRGRW